MFCAESTNLILLNFDILERITNYLSVHDVLTLLTVCKHWANLGRNTFWCNYLRNRFHVLPKIPENDESSWKSLGLAVAKKGFPAWVPVYGDHDTIGDYRDFTYSNLGGPQWTRVGDDFLSRGRPFLQLNIGTLPDEIRNLFPPAKRRGLIQCSRNETFFRHIINQDFSEINPEARETYNDIKNNKFQEIVDWKLTMDFMINTVYAEKNLAFDAVANRICGIKLGGCPVVCK